MAITTKIGDKGQTTCGNKRVDKDDLLVETVGSIDELQAVLQIAGGFNEIVEDLTKIMGGYTNVENRIEKMEEEIKKQDFNLTEFLKFKNKKAAEINWARTVCRRVERRVVSLSKKQKVDENILKYFNRLSDYLFIKAVKEN